MKATLISLIIAGVLIGGSVLLTRADSSSVGTNQASVDNVSIVDGKQVIAIGVKGGYSPRVTKAKAGIPTILEVETTGTFDCSAALVIPSINYRKNLPASGKTIIELPVQEAGSTMTGLCAMGMYSFKVVFE